jgi:hypothetical protein
MTATSHQEDFCANGLKKERRKMREKERHNMTEKKVLEIHDARGLV